MALVTGPIYEIRRDIKLCRRCPLGACRTNAVPGEGPVTAPIMLVGEAPGANEDKTGEPFVGKSGQKLDQWLSKVGLSRDDLYITNLLKCQPPENRFPRDDDPGKSVEKCLPWLHQQLELIEPAAIIVAGKNALQHLVLRGSARNAPFVDEWVGKILRRRDKFGEARIGVIFHPAYILRTKNPVDEEKCVRTLKTIANHAAARRRGEPAPLIDLEDIRPAGTPTFQQRFRVLTKPAHAPAPASPEAGEPK